MARIALDNDLNASLADAGSVTREQAGSTMAAPGFMPSSLPPPPIASPPASRPVSSAGKYHPHRDIPCPRDMRGVLTGKEVCIWSGSASSGHPKNTWICIFRVFGFIFIPILDIKMYIKDIYIDICG